MNPIDLSIARLHTIGWRACFESALCEAHAALSLDDPALAASPPMRLVEIHRDTLRLHDGRAQHPARAAPRLRRALAARDGALAVGDWVLAAPGPDGALWVHARLAPHEVVARRDADGRRHPLVSNVDTALFLMGLDADFNLRRIERYLLLVAGSGVQPVVVRTKADLVAPAPAMREAVVADEIDALRARLGGGVPVLAVDGRSPEAALRLAPWLAPGHTAVLLGSSGTGKSTLTNTLAARSLHLLPGGACVIDTPGLRALRPDADETALAAGFEDIARLAPRCRFRDCRHAGEPGCAVGAEVAPDRVRNYHKLLREARRDTLSVLDRQHQLAQWKALGRAGAQRARVKRGEC